MPSGRGYLLRDIVNLNIHGQPRHLTNCTAELVASGEDRLSNETGQHPAGYLAGMDAGALDYIIKPLHVREIIARIKMVLSRIEKRMREQEKASKLGGSLNVKALSDLIEEFSTDESTGILTLTSSTGKSGQVFFREGQVVNAIVGNFRGERAVYQMIPWGNGKYNMVFV